MRTLSLLLGAILLMLTPSVRADERDDAAAKAHYQAGVSYYEQARYDDALREFSESYRLSSRSPLLYNIAMCDERLGRLPDAIRTLEDYLRKAPEDPGRVSIETRIKSLKEQLSKATPTLTPTPALAPIALAPTKPTVEVSPPPAARPSHRLTWIAGGSAVVLLGGALVSGLIAQGKYSSLMKSCPGGACDPAVYSSAQGDIAAGWSAAVASDVLLGLGAVALVASVVLYFVEGHHGSAAPRAWLTPEPATVGAAFTTEAP